MLLREPRGDAYFSFQGQATDIAIQAEEIVKLKAILNELLAEHTGQPLSVIGSLYPIQVVKWL